MFCIYLLVMPKYWVKNYFAHGRFPKVGQKQKTEYSRDCGWPRRPWPNAGREKKKNSQKSAFFRKKIKITDFFFCIYLLVMPKYCVKNYFAHGSFPEVGQKQKTEKKKKKKKDRKLVITMAKLCMAHASRLGQNNGHPCFVRHHRLLLPAFQPPCLSTQADALTKRHRPFVFIYLFIWRAMFGVRRRMVGDLWVANEPRTMYCFVWCFGCDNNLFCMEQLKQFIGWLFGNFTSLKQMQRILYI